MLAKFALAIDLAQVYGEWVETDTDTTFTFTEESAAQFITVKWGEFDEDRGVQYFTDIGLAAQASGFFFNGYIRNGLYVGYSRTLPPHGVQYYRLRIP